MNTVSVTLGDLVDRATFELQGPNELALSTTATASMTTSSTSLTLADASAVNVNDVLEIGSELVLVTAKSADAVPVLTISRGYYQSTAAAHDSGDVVSVNPRHPRVRIADAVRRCFSRLESLGLPLSSAATLNREPGLKYAVVPEQVRDVLRVSYMSTDGKWWDLDKWEFVDDVPTGKVASGKLLRLPRYIMDDDDLEVVYRIPYRWSSHPAAPSESDTITMIEGSEDLPVLYAVAWLTARREISRTEIDRAEEWSAGEPSRGGVSSSVARLTWQEFYRSMDEARRLVQVFPVHRPFRKMQRL